MKTKGVLVVAAALLLIAAVLLLSVWVRPRSHDNVIIVTLDTTRADRLGCYGYEKAETPALDGLAAQGVRYAAAFTHVPLTLPAHATLMTGRLPPEHGLRDNGRGKLPGGMATLAEVFRGRGYRTGAFLSGFVLDRRFGLDRGFDVYDDRMASRPSEEKLFDCENPANVTCDRALDWLGQRSDAPFFCWVHFYDPHTPYAPPEPFMERHADPYDGEIAFMDSQLGRLVAFLVRAGLREKTLIVVVGDHGESFGEHKEFEHGMLVYDTTMRVPLIASFPGKLPSGEVRHEPAGLVDIPATILDVMGWARPSGVGGRSLLGMGNAEPVYGESQFAHLGYGWAPLYSVTTARWKYIACPDPELYDLPRDPDETRNLYISEPDVAAELAASLIGIRERMRPARADAVALDEDARRKLQSLGYLGGTTRAPASGVRRVLKDPKAMMDIVGICHKAERLIGSGKSTEAIDSLVPLLARSAESVLIHEHLTDACFKLGRYDEARKHVEAALALVPDNRTRIANLGAILFKQGDPVKAVELYRQCLSLPVDPLEPSTETGVSRLTVKTRLDMATALRALGRTEEASAQCEQVLREDPGNSDAHTVLGNFLNRQSRYAEAVTHYRAALKRGETNAVLHSNLGVALSQMGKLEEGIREYRRSLEIDPTDADVRVNLGDALMGIRGTAEAVAEYREAVRLSPNDPRPAEVLGRTLMQLGRDAEALSAFQRALAIAETAGAYHNVASLHGRAGRTDQAVAGYRKALKIDPGAIYARNNLGLTFCEQGRFREALELWRAGLKLEPGNPLLMYNMTWWLATCRDAGVRDADEALTWAHKLEKAAATRNSPEFNDAVGVAYATAGRFDQAILSAQKAVKLATGAGRLDLATAIRGRLALYRSGKPFRQGE